MMKIMQDDVDQELLPLFVEEANELYPQIRDALLAWRDQPDSAEMRRRLQRALHTLKGSARMAGVMRIGELAHRMEDLVTGTPRAISFWDDLQSHLDSIRTMVDQLESGSSVLANNGNGAEDDTTQTQTEDVPFSHISRRLYRVVRQTGKELGKKVNLELRGAEIQLDRGVLEKLTAPFEHMLRNAIAHGLEKAEKRRAKGKPPMGEICLSLQPDNGALMFEICDDGAGLDLDRLRRKAIEKGVLQPDEAASDEEIIRLIFVTGLSTANKVTEVAGRGVGMDVVASEIEALGGHIDVSSERDKGTRFLIRLPLANRPGA